MEVKSRTLLIILVFFVIIEILLVTSQSFSKFENAAKLSGELSGPNVCVHIRDLGNRTVKVRKMVPVNETKKSEMCSE